MNHGNGGKGYRTVQVRLRRQNLEMVGVPRLDRAEMPPVQGSHFAFAQFFARDHDRGIHQTQIQIPVLRLELDHAPHLFEGELFQAVGSFRYVRDEDGPHFGRKPLAYPVVDLDEGCGNDDEGFVELFQQVDTASMSGIVGIENGQDRARIEDQSHLLCRRKVFVIHAVLRNTRPGPPDTHVWTTAAAELRRLFLQVLAHQGGERNFPSLCLGAKSIQDFLVRGNRCPLSHYKLIVS